MSLSLNWFQNKYHELNGTNDLWVAYSGGVDSSVLLELCHQYTKISPNIKLQAIHINHDLNKNSDQWAAHCLATCNALNIPCYVMPVNLDLTSGESIEAIARHARRTIWQSLLPTNGTLLLAHHEQDQAETILHRLFRGAGPTGLSGMSESCKFGNGILLRPLLKMAKENIDLFASLNNLSWVIDSSNQEQKFDRNFIRNAIIPELTKRWPTVVANITRSGELCREAKTLVALEIETLILNSKGKAPATLSIKKLLELNDIRCFAVLRAWIEIQNYEMPSRNQLYRIKSEVMQAKGGVTPKLQCSQYMIRRYRDDLYLLPKPQVVYQESQVIEVKPNQEQAIKLVCGRILNFRTTIGSGFVLSDSIQAITISLGSSGEKAKKIFQQHGVPPWERHKYPLIFIGQLLIAIAGLWIRPDFVALFGKPGYEITLV